MKGRHEVYCIYLSKKETELKGKIEELQKVRCFEFDNIPDDRKPIHNECSFINLECMNDECRTKCKYYREKIEPLDCAVKELSEAQKVLEREGEKDFWAK